MKPPLVPCHACDGTGQAPLSEPLMETLLALGRRRASAAELAVPGITPNAINNRLETLRALGLVQRQRRGRFWFYRAAPKRDAVPTRRTLPSTGGAR